MQEYPKIVATNGMQIAKLKKMAEQGISDINSICVQLTKVYTEGNDAGAYLIATTEEKISRLKKFIAQLQELTALW